MVGLFSVVLIISGAVLWFIIREFEHKEAEKQIIDMKFKHAEMKRVLEERRLNLDKENEDYEKAYREFERKFGAIKPAVDKPSGPSGE